MPTKSPRKLKLDFLDGRKSRAAIALAMSIIGRRKRGVKERPSEAKRAANAISLPLATLVKAGKLEEAQSYRAEHFERLIAREKLRALSAGQ